MITSGNSSKKETGAVRVRRLPQKSVRQKLTTSHTILSFITHSCIFSECIPIFYKYNSAIKVFFSELRVLSSFDVCVVRFSAVPYSFHFSESSFFGNGFDKILYAWYIFSQITQFSPLLSLYTNIIVPTTVSYRKCLRDNLLSKYVRREQVLRCTLNYTHFNNVGVLRKVNRWSKRLIWTRKTLIIAEKWVLFLE